MYYAREVRSGSDVGADQAVSGRSYLCPVCRAPVSLRDGRYRVAHFAHRPGVGRAECELYHPAWGQPASPIPEQLTGHQLDQAQTAHTAPLELSIELSPPLNARAAQRRAWGLCVTVPQSGDGRGKIRLDTGSFGYREIGLANLMASKRSYPVDPEAQVFRAVWASPDVARGYAEAVTERLEGLAREKISVFVATSDKTKPRAASLSWGASYYFIRPKTLPYDLPPSLITRQLAPLSQWECSLVTLPEYAQDLSLERWLQENTGLFVTTEKRRWGIVYPPPFALNPDGQITLPADSHIELLLFADPIEGHNNSVITARVGQSSESLEIARGRWGNLSVRTSEPFANAAVRLDWDGHQLPDIVRTQPSTASTIEVTLEISTDGETDDCFPLHYQTAADALALSRPKSDCRARLNIPSGLAGVIRYRAQNGIWVETPAAVADLSVISKQPDLEIEIDFGPFGFISLAPLKQVVVQRPLPCELRQKLLWFCKASSAYKTRAGAIIADASDEELREHFRAIIPAAYLVAHHRSLLHEMA